MDWILLVDVYHELQEPQPMLAKIRRALKPGGRVALVEYRAEDKSASDISPPHRMSVEQVLREWTPAGFELVQRIETLPTQHLFISRAR
jgi:predicted methyltransferase